MGEKPVITIDGPVGSGKSTVGRQLAERLGFVYLDTGAMYRVVALEADRAGIPADDAAGLEQLCRTIEISFRPGPAGQLVFSGGCDVTHAIRTPAISMLASKISALPEVRRQLVHLQREAGRDGGIVVDGRDAGTVIFPAAQFKFYLDASLEVRAERRHKELVEKKIKIDYNSIFYDIKKRDHDDSTRDAAPLKPAEDAVIVDTTGMSIEEVLERLLLAVGPGTSSSA